jgi:hypothetical protein
VTNFGINNLITKTMGRREKLIGVKANKFTCNFNFDKGQLLAPADLPPVKGHPLLLS